MYVIYTNDTFLLSRLTVCVYSVSHLLAPLEQKSFWLLLSVAADPIQWGQLESRLPYGSSVERRDTNRDGLSGWWQRTAGFPCPTWNLRCRWPEDSCFGSVSHRWGETGTGGTHSCTADHPWASKPRSEHGTGGVRWKLFQCGPSRWGIFS